MIKYSTIIPVYNAQKTLKRCVTSIIEQHREDVEIILVNDGSTDESGKICESFAEKYNRIRYIKQANKGVSTARNQGIRMAQGTYITFLDSDDYVADTYYHVIDQLIDEKEYDLIQFSRYHVTGENIQVIKEIPSTAYCVDESMFLLQQSMCNKTINSPVTKVYKRKLIHRHQIWFPESISIGEDKVFNVKYALYIESYKIVSTPLYYVCFENEGSLSRKKREDLEEQFAKIRTEIEDAIRVSPISEKNKQLLFCAENFLKCRDVYKTAKALHRDKIKLRNRWKCLKQCCNEINARKMQYPKSRYCWLITFPVRFNLVILLDVIGGKLTH